MGKIIVPVNEELIALNPDANLETCLGETITMYAPGLGLNDGTIISFPEAGEENATSSDLVGGQPPKGPKVTD